MTQEGLELANDVAKAIKSYGKLLERMNSNNKNWSITISCGDYTMKISEKESLYIKAFVANRMELLKDEFELM